MTQGRLFDGPVMSIREFVRARLAGLEWRQKARAERRARRAAAKRRRTYGPLFAGGGIVNVICGHKFVFGWQAVARG